MSGRSFAQALGSKWTAVHPQNGEKHFIVTRIADTGKQLVKLECVVTRSARIIAFADLTRGDVFLSGWR